MIDSTEIRSRVKEVAKLIHEDYKGKRPILLCTLKGANPFYTHLSDALQDLRQGYDMEFVRASSYEGTETTGTVQLTGLKAGDILAGRLVVIVEDILDTGTTLSYLVPQVKKEFKAASVEVCTLLDKRLDKGVAKKYAAKYVGFSIPNHFIIGYGLDFNELYRDLKDIFVISQTGIDFDARTLHV
jgi:hypoxanthine phosphoribosyltransferase